MSPTSFHRSFYGDMLALDAMPAGPTFPQVALDFDFRAAEGAIGLPLLYGSYNPSYRTQLAARCRDVAFDVADPFALPPALRSPRWNAMLSWLTEVDDLPPERQRRLLFLVSKLGFCAYVERLLTSRGNDVSLAPELAYVLAWVRYRQWLDGGCPDYRVEEFARVAESALPGATRLDALYQLVAQSAKHARDVAACERWQHAHAAALSGSVQVVEDTALPFVRSRFHRVGAFIPQMRGDMAAMHAEMDLAEEYARMVPRNSADEVLAADEILYPVMQSRMQEFRVVRDYDRAIAYSTVYLTMSPNDPRGYLHRANLLLDVGRNDEAVPDLLRCATLAPPGQEIATFLLGECARVANRVEEAAHWYLTSLEIDPLGTSAVEGLSLLGDQHAVTEYASRRTAAAA